MFKKLLIIIVTLFQQSVNCIEYSSIVMTSNGPVKGVIEYYDNITLYSFLGIPYARPPIGDLRFRRPQKVAFNEAIYEATTLKAACIQVVPLTDIFVPGSDEDCLYLNILVTMKAFKRLKNHLTPVIVYLFGSGFNFDSVNRPPFLSNVLVATQDVILVDIQYRLSLFGFSYHILFREEFFGNIGLYDQNMALVWIKKNIAKFGGDPDNVTLWGQSAGAISVSAHLVAPLARGLFNRAIISSGPAIKPQIMPRLRTTMSTQHVLNATGCSLKLDKVSCLSQFNASHLITLVPTKFLPFFPVFDSEYIPVKQDGIMLDPKYPPMDIDILIGTTSQDGSLFEALPFPEIILKPQLSKVDVIENIASIYNSKFVATILKWYIIDFNYTTSQQFRRGLFNIFTDIFSGCVSWEQNRRHLKFMKKGKIYAYILAQKPSTSYFPPCIDKLFGVCHGDDVIFALGAPYTSELLFTDKDRAISKEMMKSWADFAKTG